MGFTIALAGKGGTGKTTLAALTIRYLLNKGKKPILAVDADANENLGEALGIKVDTTIGEIIDETMHRIDDLPGGMGKDAYIEYRLNAAVAEGSDVDLLVMGRPEGPGCYCYANNILRGHLGNKNKGYPYVVMDNEAGLEHLSRRTTNNVDLFLVVSDSSVRGLKAAKRVRELIDEVGLHVRQRFLVVTKVTAPLEGPFADAALDTGLELAGTVPFDPLVGEFDLYDKPLVGLPEEAPVVRATFGILERVLG